MMWDGIEHRKSMTIKLDPAQAKLIEEMHFILTDPEVGLRKAVKRQGETLYGNGQIGLKTQILLIWCLVAILGIESPIVGKVIKLVTK